MMLWLARRRGTKPGTWLLRHVPENLIEYPFETLVAVWALISGVVSLTFTNVPTSIANFMPAWVGVVWGVALVMGGTSTAIGLRKRWYATLVPRGTQLVAVALLFYAVAVIGFLGFRSLPNALLMVVIAILLLLRAWYLQIREAIFLDIARESDR